MRLQRPCYGINSQLLRIIDCCHCRRHWRQHSPMLLVQMAPILVMLFLVYFPHRIRTRRRIRIRIRSRWLLFGYLRNRLQLNYLSCQMMMRWRRRRWRAEKREFLKIFHTCTQAHTQILDTHTNTDTHTHTHTQTERKSKRERERAKSVKNRTKIVSLEQASEVENSISKYNKY